MTENEKLSALERHTLSGILGLEKEVVTGSKLTGRPIVFGYNEHPDKVYHAAKEVVGEDNRVVEEVASHLLNYTRFTKRNNERVVYGISLLGDVGLAPEEIAQRAIVSLIDRRNIDNGYSYAGYNCSLIERYHDGFREAKKNVDEQYPELSQPLTDALAAFFTPEFIDEVVDEIKAKHEKYRELSELKRLVQNEGFDQRGYDVDDLKRSAEVYRGLVRRETDHTNELLQDLEKGLGNKPFSQRGYEKSKAAIVGLNVYIDGVSQDICSKLDEIKAAAKVERKPWYKRLLIK